MMVSDFSSIPNEVYFRRSDDLYAEEQARKASARLNSFGVDLSQFRFSTIDSNGNLVGILNDGSERVVRYAPDGRRIRSGITKEVKEWLTAFMKKLGLNFR